LKEDEVKRENKHQGRTLGHEYLQVFKTYIEKKEPAMEKPEVMRRVVREG
jgi:hypothetical protein